MIKAGGERLIAELDKLCNQVWREVQIVTEWTRSVLITIPKKGDLAKCNNYRTISLMNHMSKVLMSVLLERLKAQMETRLSEEQAGFRIDRSTVHQILILRLPAEKAKHKGRLIYNCFVNFRKAFDSINHGVTRAVFKSYGVGTTLIQLLQKLGETAVSAVRVDRKLGDLFSTTAGTRQGDPISPTVFISYLERLMDTIQNNDTGVSVQGCRINNLKVADDIDLLEESQSQLQDNVTRLHEAEEAAGLHMKCHEYRQDKNDGDGEC